MKKLSDVVTQRLEWVQPALLKSEFEFRANGEPVGRLEIASVWGSKATAELGDGSWTFKRVGFWQQTASVRRTGADEDVAIFKNNTWQSGGTLTFSNGRVFRATTNFWSTRMQFESETSEPLVRYHYGGVFKMHADVEVTAAGRILAEAPVLVMFGWYLAVMLHRDAAGTS